MGRLIIGICDSSTKGFFRLLAPSLHLMVMNGVDVLENYGNESKSNQQQDVQKGGVVMMGFGGRKIGVLGERCLRKGGKNVRDAAGFTLIEIIIAMGVFSLTALGVVSGLSKSYEIDTDVSQQIEAQNFARHVMEELLIESFDVVTFEDMISSYNNTQVTSDNNNLQATLDIDQILPSSGAATLVRFQVTVTEPGDNEQLARIVTLRSQRQAPSSAWLSN